MNIHPWPLAQVNPLDFGRNFREAEQNFQWTNVVLVVAIILAIVFALWLLLNYIAEREGRSYHSPRKLFRELCHAHGLDRGSRQLLKRLASAHRLTHPSQLFLDPERFDVLQLDTTWVAERSTLESLRDQIFGQKLPDQESTTSD
jgi:hypothetical protein